MSKTVDQKVVQMQFDNAGFEQNAKQTMSTLDKLKAALKFDGANKGAEELNKSIKGIDFSQAEIAATKAGFHIQDVWLKISNVLEYQIARKIINLGENIAKSLTFDQVTAGFHEYELKMGSIQTIMAGTGESLEVVNKYLNELNEYSDKTIYSFSDMTQNIGKFTNAGVQLKDAVAAIQGVANVAAVSGANANEASRAMYNFAQALSAGYVKLIDWKSIENANMATVEFKDTLLQTAVAMGTAEAKGDGMYKILTKNAQGKTMEGLVSSTKNFNDSLQQQWMTTNVLTQALEIYSKDVRTMTDEEKKNYENKLLGIGFTKEQIYQFEQLGIKATKAASEVKTFSQLIDTIKESIGSGWAMSFEHIIGNFEEAKQLFTEISEGVGIVISRMDSQRNKMLENWKRMGGREDLIAGFRNLAGAMSDLFAPVKKVFDEIFGRLSSDKLYEITKGFRDWTTTLRMNKEEQEEFRLVLHYLLIPIKVLVEAIKVIIKIIPSVLEAGVKLIKLLVSLGAYIIEAAKNSQTFKTIIAGLKTGFDLLKTGIVSVIKFFKELATTITSYVITALKDENSWISKTIGFLKTLGGITLIGLRTAFESLANFKFSNVTSALETMKNKLKEVSENSKIVKLFLSLLDSLKERLQVIGAAFGIFFDSLNERLQKAQTFTDFLKALWDSLKDGFTFLKDFIESKFFTDGPKLFETIKNSVSDFVDVLKGGMKEIPWAKLILISFTIALAACTINLITAISRFGGLAMALKETITIINQTIKTFTTLRNRLIELKEIAIFITAITAAIAILSIIDKENGNLIKAAATLGILAAGLMILAEAMLWINTKNALAPASLASLFASIGAIAVGTAILVAAAGALKDMSLAFKEALPYIETLGVLMLGMLGAMTVLTLIGKDHKIFTAGATTILAFAGSVYILANALKSMAEIQFPNINDLLKVLISIFAGFAVLFTVSSKVFAKSKSGIFKGGASGFNILVFAASLKIIASALNELASINLTADAKKVLDMVLNLVKYFGTIITTAIVLKSIFGKTNMQFAKIGKDTSRLKGIINSFSLSLLAVSASFFIIIKTFETIKETLKTGSDWAKLVGTLAIFTTLIISLIGAFALINTVTKTTVNKNSILKFSISLVALATALVPLSLCLDLIASIVASHSAGEIVGASAIIAGIGALMIGLMWASGQASFTDFRVLLTIFAGFSVLLGELIAISMLMENHGADMLKGLGIMALVVVEMWAALKMLTSPKINVTGYSIAPLIAIVSGLVALSGVLVGLTFLVDSDVGNSIWKALGVLGLIAAGLIAVIASLSGINKKLGAVGSIIKPLIGVVGSIVVLVGTLVLLSEEIKRNGEAIKTAMIDMGIIAVGLVVLFGAFSIINNEIGSAGNWASLLSFAAVVVALAGGLLLLAQVPWEQLAAAGVILIGFGAGMALVMTMVTGITDGSMGTAALVIIIFAAAVDSMALSLAVLANGAAVFINAVTKLVDAFTRLGRSGKDVANGLKEAVPTVAWAIKQIAVAIREAAPDIALAIRDIMVGISKGIADGSVYIAQGVATVIAVLLPVINDAMATIGATLWEGIKSIISGLASSVFEFVSAGQEIVAGLVSGLLGGSDLAQVAGTWISQLLTGLIPGFGALFNAGINLKNSFLKGAIPSSGEINSVVTEYHSATEAMGGAIYTGMEKEVRKQKKLAESVPPAVVNSIKKAGNDGSKYARESSTKITDSFYAGWQPMDRYLQEARNKATDFGKVITGPGSLTDKFGTLLNSGIKAVTDYAADKASPVLDEFSKFTEGLVPNLDDVTNAAAGAGAGLEGLGKSASKGAKGVKEAKDEITSFVEKMESSFNILEEFDLGLDEENPLTGDKLIQNMQSNITGMTTWANEMVSIAGKVPEGLYKKLADMGPQGYKYVHAFAQMTEEQLMQVQTLYAQSLIIPTSVTAMIYSGMNEAATNAYTGFVNGLNIPQMQKDGITMATTFIGGLKTGLDSHSPSRKTFDEGVNAAFGFSNGLTSPASLGVAKIAVEDFCRLVLDTFRDELPVKEFVSMGRSIAEGLGEGIDQGESSVGSKIAKLCAKVTAIARSRDRGLDINSPSKVFVAIGKSVDEGLAKGITDNVNMIDNSVSKMADQTVNNMRGAIETIQTIADSDLNVEPVIRPVVDLSNVQNGANSINSLMGMNFGTNVTMPAASFMTTSNVVSNTDNTNVVTAITSLREDIGSLKNSISNIKMVLDSGTMVGAMVEDIDTALGKRMVYAGRGI